MYQLYRIKKIFSSISEAHKCMIGACLIYAGLGGVIIWNNINIYLVSYYHQMEPTLEYSVFSTIISLIGFFSLVSGFLAVKIQAKINYINFLRIWMPMFTLFLVLTSQTDSPSVFIFFYSILMGLTQGLTFIPTLKCIWQHY